MINFILKDLRDRVAAVMQGRQTIVVDSELQQGFGKAAPQVTPARHG
jgi:hypothetical protein